MREPRALPVLAAFLRRSFLEQTVHWTPAVLQLIGFAVGLLSQAYLGRLVDAAPNGELGAYAGHYAAYLLFGMAILDLQNAVVSSLSWRIRDAQVSGSLESLLATPTPTSLVLAAMALPEVLWSFARLGLYAVMGVLLFGVDFSVANLAGAALILLVAMFGFAAVALVGAALTMALRRANPLNLLVASTSMIAGGVLYPRGILPHPLALLGELLPITPALDGLRGAMVHGLGPAQLGRPLLHLAVFAILGCPLGAWLFARLLRAARRDGSLTSY